MEISHLVKVSLATMALDSIPNVNFITALPHAP